MYNLLEDLYTILLNDEVVSQYITENDIKFYEYPNAQEITGNLIIIDEVISPEIVRFGDDMPTQYEYIFQIDVFVKQNSNNNGALDSNVLILRIQDLMFSNNFKPFNSFAPDYNTDHSLYRQSKQFRGRKYKN